MIHRKKNDLVYKGPQVCVTSSGKVNELTGNRKQARSPSVSPHYCFVGGVKVLGEGCTRDWGGGGGGSS